MLKVKVGYPSKQDELKVLDRMAGAAPAPRASKVMTPDEVLHARAVARQVFVDDKVKRYVVDVVHATRDPGAAKLDALAGLIENGASPRASINLVLAAKALALLEGRSYVTPHDVKSVAPDVLRHRVLLTYEAEAEEKTPDDVVRMVLENVEVP
jgi:MoxR-like ATPase